MSTLITHAGRFGDCLWALPTVRAISEALGEPVDFCISWKYRDVIPLVEAQPYVRRAFADVTWEVQESAPITPPEPVLEHRDEHGPYEKTIHLSFRGWPEAPTLAEGYWLNGKAAVPEVGKLELGRPWIKVSPDVPHDLTIGFTDEYFELKFGLSLLVEHACDEGHPLAAEGSRWHKEGCAFPTTWLQAAELIAGSKAFLGCLSGLAVLAAALGKPRVLVEPNEQRWHPVFRHWDTELVKGLDGKPTFDARHVVEAVRGRLG